MAEMTEVILSYHAYFLFLYSVLGADGDSCSSHRSPSCDPVNSIGTKTSLYIGGFFSMTESEAWDGSGCLMAAELALEQINNRTDILADYELKMTWNDSQCTATRSPRILFEFIHNDPGVMVLLGTPCSAEALVVTPAASHWNLITVVYSALAPQLSDRTKYPNLFRTVPVGPRIFNDPLLWLVQRYNWRRVGYITGSDESLATVLDDFVRRAAAYNLTVISEVITGQAQNQIEQLKYEDVRIVFVYGNEEHLRPVFCASYRAGFYGPDILWIIPQWAKAGWWLFADSTTMCTAEELSHIVETSLPIIIDVSPISSLGRETVAGISPSEFIQELERRLSFPQYRTYSLNNYMSFTFDAVWSIALSLHNASKALEARNSSKRLEDFTYDDEDIYTLIFDGLTSTDFFGVSGPVSFTDGERLGSSDISQMRGRCRSGWHIHTRRCYKLMEYKTDWQSGVMVCQQNGGELADLSSEDEVSFLSTLRKANQLASQWHVGLHYVTGSTDDTTARVLVDLQNRTSDVKLEDESGDCLYFDFGENTFKVGNCQEERPFICEERAKFDYTHIAAYTSATDDVFWIDAIEWPGGDVPADGPVIQPIITEREEELLPAFMHVIVTSLAAIGVILTLMMSIFIVISAWRHGYQLLRVDAVLSGMVILFSCTLMYSSVTLTRSETISEVTNDQQHSICRIHSIVGSVGFSLGVATLVSQIWLIYYTSSRSSGVKSPRLWQVYAIPTMFVMIDAVILIVVNIYYPLRVAEVTISTEVNPDNVHHVTAYYHTICTRGDDVISVLLHVDKMLLLLTGAFLTYEIKQGKVVATGYKTLSAALYNIIMFGACGLILSLLLSDSLVDSYAFSSAIILCCTTMTLLILFIPMITNFEEHFNKRIDSSSSTFAGDYTINRTPSNLDGNSIPKELLERNERLKKQYDELKRQLREKKGTYRPPDTTTEE